MIRAFWLVVAFAGGLVVGLELADRHWAPLLARAQAGWRETLDGRRGDQDRTERCLTLLRAATERP